MTKSESKVNFASLRCLQTLLYLFEKDMSMKELINTLDQESRGEFNNFIASKYINTCKSCGMDIQKIDGKYTLLNFPFGPKISQEDAELVFEIKQNSEIVKSEKTEKCIKSLVDKLHLTYYKSANGLKSSKNYKIIKLFEKALYANSEIELIYHSGETKRCIPADIYAKDGKIYFKTKYGCETADVDPDEILNITLTDKSVRKTKIEDNGIVFELTGKLAKRYQPRENEQIIKFKKNGNIVVLNRYEEPDILLHRLMRYDSLCKVLKPDIYAEEMKNMIERTLGNYSE